MMKRILHFAASLLVFGAALWWVSLEDVLARLKSADSAWIAVALLSLILSTISMARRWQITAKTLGLELPYRHALREYFLSLVINMLVPGGIVGDVSRAFRLRRKGDLKRAAQSVFAERLLGQGALLLVLVIGMAITLVAPGAIIWPKATVWVLCIGLLGGMAVLACLARAKRIADFALFCKGLLMQPAVTLHAIFAAGLLIFALYACARATGSLVPLEASVTVLPLVLCAMLIPLSVAGWGWREGAAAALFPLFGASAEAGIAMSICYGSVMLLAALPGGALVLTAQDKKPELGRI